MDPVGTGMGACRQMSSWLDEQGLTSYSTQFRSFRRRCFNRWVNHHYM